MRKLILDRQFFINYSSFRNSCQLSTAYFLINEAQPMHEIKPKPPLRSSSLQPLIGSFPIENRNGLHRQCVHASTVHASLSNNRVFSAQFPATLTADKTQHREYFYRPMLTGCPRFG
ncbi:hypothetical protein WA026_002212 [Henosepilachna vigintioctopunctata]|uniref:Uncharacterized protein n=1 Tax=Henosepilachna vigintioctopunctata TaxID=420089 RepID=A0AAW1TZ42_9CUCU